MGEFEAVNGRLDQAKTTETNDTGWIKHVVEDKQPASDAKQQRQSQTASCVDKGLLPECVLSDSSVEPKQAVSANDRLAPQVSRDSSGRITSVEHTNGVKYEFKNFDDNGQSTSFKITRAGDKDYGEWKREKDGLWRAYDNGKATSQVIVGEWKVNEKGELSHTGHQEMRSVPAEKSSHHVKDREAEKSERAANSKESSKSHEPSLNINADGKVTEVTRANGETTKFKYGPDGNLTEVKLPGGTVLTTTDGTNWKNSETGKTSELKVEVKDDGTYSLEQDGKKAVLLPNGNAVRMDVGTPDRVTSVTKADGETTSFKYSPDGKLSEVTLPHGTVLTTTDGKTWMNSETGKSSDLKVEVESDGTYSLEQGGKKAVLRPDGTEVRSDVPAGAPERITSVTHADGRTSEFKYGPGGKLNEVKLPGGTGLTTTDGKNWINSETGETSEMKIEVQKDGTYSIERDGKIGIIHPDGTITNGTILKDGTRVVENKDGTQSTYNPDGTYSIADGITTQYFDAKGNLTGQVTYDEARHVLIHTDKDGRVEKTVGRVASPDEKEREFKYDDKGLVEIKGTLGTWKRMEGPDGKEYWQNQDKPELKWNGKMSVDQQGNLHYTPDDPDAPAWTFTSDGRDVPVSRGGHAIADKHSARASAPKDSAKGQHQPRPQATIDASVPIPRDLFDREGTPSTVKVRK